MKKRIEDSYLNDEMKDCGVASKFSDTDYASSFGSNPAQTPTSFQYKNL